jgi:hypothetical protein
MHNAPDKRARRMFANELAETRSHSGASALWRGMARKVDEMVVVSFTDHPTEELFFSPSWD